MSSAVTFKFQLPTIGSCGTFCLLNMKPGVMCVISWQTGRLLYAVTDVGDGDALNAGRVHGEGTEVHRQSIHAD